MKIVEFKGQYKITLPKDLVEDKGWKTGQVVEFLIEESGDDQKEDSKR